MPVIVILSSVALMGVAFAVGLLMITVGIRRGDRGKRLTGRPGSNCEAFARRLLTGSRGYKPPSDGGRTDE